MQNFEAINVGAATCRPRITKKLGMGDDNGFWENAGLSSWGFGIYVD